MTHKTTRSASSGKVVATSDRKGDFELHRGGDGRISGSTMERNGLSIRRDEYGRIIESTTWDGDHGRRYDSDNHYVGSTERKGDEETKRDSSGNLESTTKPSSGGCFLTSACVEAKGLPDDCLELTTLRQFRESYLIRQPDGPAAIAHYYAVAPAIVQEINSQPNAKEVYGQLFNELVIPCVELIHEGKLAEALTMYRSTVTRLEREYLQQPTMEVLTMDLGELAANMAETERELRVAPRIEEQSVFAAQFLERPVYRGVEEANQRLSLGERIGYFMSSPTACGSYGLDDG